MASYRGHLLCSSALGLAYCGLAVVRLHFDWLPVLLGAGLTAVGGLLPDLDSASGVPRRATFTLLALAVPLLLFRRLLRDEVPPGETFFAVALAYVLIRYVLSRVFGRLTVHRGMFHSIPAMLISGLCVFVLDQGAPRAQRLYLAGGVMIGFLSHLILDEICSVDFMGLHLKKSAGSALKLASKSSAATLSCYAILAALALLAWRDLGR